MTKKQPRRLKPKKGATKASALAEAKATADVRRDLWRSAERDCTTLRESLGEMIAMVTAIGGFLKPEHQEILRHARRVHGGS